MRVAYHNLLICLPIRIWYEATEKTTTIASLARIDATNWRSINGNMLQTQKSHTYNNLTNNKMMQGWVKLKTEQHERVDPKKRSQNICIIDKFKVLKIFLETDKTLLYVQKHRIRISYHLL